MRPAGDERSSSIAPQLCRTYARTGACRYGRRCIHVHVDRVHARTSPARDAPSVARSTHRGEPSRRRPPHVTATRVRSPLKFRIAARATPSDVVLERLRADIKRQLAALDDTGSTSPPVIGSPTFTVLESISDDDHIEEELAVGSGGEEQAISSDEDDAPSLSVADGVQPISDDDGEVQSISVEEHDAQPISDEEDGDVQPISDDEECEQPISSDEEMRAISVSSSSSPQRISSDDDVDDDHIYPRPNMPL